MNTPPGEKLDTDTAERYDVVLLNTGNNKVEVARILRGYTTVGLREAKNLTEDLPKLVCEAIDQNRAHELAKTLVEYDAGVSIRKHTK